ncbi:MAG: MlaD family protein, partial [Verrucomicrobia bacterium]|nr:MlaD family protein [Verrucomicrobiota bacterium]
MKTVRSDFLIAAAVILCTLVLLGALSLAISGTDLNRPKALLTIDLPSAVGLDRQAQVRYAGTIAGRIRSIRPLTDEERIKESPSCLIRVVAEIRHPLPPIRAGTTAAVISDTVLAEK